MVSPVSWELQHGSLPELTKPYSSSITEPSTCLPPWIPKIANITPKGLREAIS